MGTCLDMGTATCPDTHGCPGHPVPLQSLPFILSHPAGGLRQAGFGGENISSGKPQKPGKNQASCRAGSTAVINSRSSLEIGAAVMKRRTGGFGASAV